MSALSDFHDLHSSTRGWGAMVYPAPTMTDKTTGKKTDQKQPLAIRTDEAPAPIGPYSQGIRAGDLVFVSGQIPIDPKTGKLVHGDVEDQTRQVLANLKAILEASGSDLSRVVKATVYITDMSVFPRINAVYAKAFDTDPPPARATVEVSALPMGAHVEIDAIATTR